MVAALDGKVARPVDAQTVHGLLAVLWLLKDNPTMALAEADQCAASDGQRPETLALAVRMVAPHKLEYPQASAREYGALKACLAASGLGSPEQVDLEHRVALVALILVSLQQEDDATAVQSAEALAAIRGLDYIPPLVRLTVAAREGRLPEAAQELRALKTSPAFERHRQALLAELEAAKGKAPAPEELYERFVAVLTGDVLEDLFGDVRDCELFKEAQALTERLKG